MSEESPIRIPGVLTNDVFVRVELGVILFILDALTAVKWLQFTDLI